MISIGHSTSDDDSWCWPAVRGSAHMQNLAVCSLVTVQGLSPLSAVFLSTASRLGGPLACHSVVTRGCVTVMKR